MKYGGPQTLDNNSFQHVSRVPILEKQAWAREIKDLRPFGSTGPLQVYPITGYEGNISLDEAAGGWDSCSSATL